eukprot:TRINITY_DN13321_c0_g1_i1.p1 TRINITY_DN13321_c0_g1~~TRINITY_DN13321_c0_g1_i1.p1  ORF type:complete len:203 (-),score=46.92 TRINITY_DN13321_c0_g1_i1:39-647(-)
MAAATVGTICLAAGPISAGSSIAAVASSFGGFEVNVAFKLEIENYTKDHLSVHQNKINSGHVSKPPVDVKPGFKEGMAGHKVANTATGCSGTVSWTIGHQKMLVVMYSIPYSHDWHSNWCAVGIFDKGDTTDHFQMMYNNAEKGFKRKDFYRNTDPVIYQDANNIAVVNMGTTHKPELQVRLYPSSIEDLANKHSGEAISFQ